MNAWLGIAAAAVVGLAIGGCETQEMKKAEMKSDAKMAEGKMLDAEALTKAFKNGGSCQWKTASAEGEDFYFTTEGASSGVADRYIDGKQTPGTWALKGDKLCLNFGKENCTALTEVGKNTYKATHASGAPMEMKC